MHVMTWCQIPGDLNIQHHCFENLVSHSCSCLTNISMWMSIGRLIIIATVTGSEFQTTAID